MRLASPILFFAIVNWKHSFRFVGYLMWIWNLFHLNISNIQPPDHRRVALYLWALFKTRPSNSPILCSLGRFFLDVRRIIFGYVHYIQLFMYLQLLKKNSTDRRLKGTYLHLCTWLFNCTACYSFVFLLKVTTNYYFKEFDDST